MWIHDLFVVLGPDAVARPDRHGEAAEDGKQDGDLHGPRISSHSKRFSQSQGCSSGMFLGFLLWWLVTVYSTTVV